MATILVTGFEPFGGSDINASFESVKNLPEKIGAHKVIVKKLPVVFKESAELIISYAEELNVDYVIAVGEAGGRTRVTPEQIGINMRSARIADNKGNTPWNELINPEGSDGIFSALPVQEITKKLQDEGLEISVSYTAGTFICNDVMYSLLDYFKDSNVKCGFIHVPTMDVEIDRTHILKRFIEELN